MLPLLTAVYMAIWRRCCLARDVMWCITGSARTSWSEGIPRTCRCRNQRWTRNSRAAGKTSVYPPWRRTVWPEYGTSSHSLLYNILHCTT